MFERILVPLDFSKDSINAINCINQFRDAKEVILLNVIARDPNAWAGNAEDELRSVKAKLEEHANHLKSIGLTVKTKAEMLRSDEGISNAIHRIADEEDVSLILMGAECKQNMENIPVGSVSKELSCHDDTHLMIIYRRPTNKDKELERDFCSNLFANVLLPTDFSKDARTANFFVTKLRGVNNITLLHVIPEASEDEINSQAKIAMGKLNALACDLVGRDELNSMSFLGVKLSEADLRCRICSERLNIFCHVLIGNPVQKILELAEKEKVSLIALNSSSKNSNNMDMKKGVANEVAMTACRNVLLVRSKKVPLLGRV
ncbi:MAG: universal stress protein [Methanotrichaceae archaeon]